MKGAYLLLIKSEGGEITLAAGKSEEIPRGVLAYVGSAWGPGGLGARIGRHLRKEKKIRWHVDRLLASNFASVLGFVAVPGASEDDIWMVVRKVGRPVMPGFGCSDKKEHGTHLYMIDSIQALLREVRERFEDAVILQIRP